MRPTAFACLVFVASAGSVRATGADDDARRDFAQGVALAQQHDFASAIALFERSYRASPVAEVLLDIALSQKALGHPLAAIETVRRYLAEAQTRPKGLPVDKRDEAEAILIELQAELGTIELAAPAGTAIAVDGARIGDAPLGPIKVDPGTHAITATFSNGERTRIELGVAPGATAHGELTPQPVVTSAPSPPPPVVVRAAPIVEVRPAPSPRSFWSTPRGYATIGVGAVALGLVATGAVTGAIVLDDRATYRTSCTLACNDDLYAHAHGLAVATDVVLGIGGVAAVTTALLVLTRPARAGITATPMVRADTVGVSLQGAF
jgi:hypothetical protein